MQYELSGKVKAVFDIEKITDTFSKREFVVTSPGDYPQDVIFQCSGKKLDIADNLREGQEVTVHFNINGRHWKENRYFVTLPAWKIDVLNVPEYNEPPRDDQVPPSDFDEDSIPF